MSQRYLPIQLSILKFLYMNNPKSLAIGQICRNNEVQCLLPPSLSLRKQKEEINKHLEYLAGKGLITKKKPITQSNSSTCLYLISTKGIDFYEKEQSEMQTTSELKLMINDDIEKLNVPSSYELLEQIKTKYQTYIDAVRDVNLDYFASSLDKDTKKLQNALIAFKTFGYQNNNQASSKPSITINNENVNNNSFHIDISFNEIKEDIQSNTYLTDDQISEILSRIDELEQIDKDEKTKKGKWAKAKPVLNWLGTQGVDIAVKIMPLILKLVAQE